MLAAVAAPRAKHPIGAGVATVDPRDVVLRWRTRWLLRGVPAAIGSFVRAAPILFQCSFAGTSLREPPPGIEIFHRKRGLGALARRVGLPPPSGWPRGKRLLRGLVALWRNETLELWCHTAGRLGPEDTALLQRRMENVERLATLRGLPVRVFLLDGERAPVSALAVFGALLCGNLSAELWSRAESTPFTHTDWEGASDAETRFLCLVLAGADPSAAIALAAHRRVAGPGFRTAYPAALLVSWARTLHPTLPAWDAAPSGSAASVLSLGRAWAVAAALAVRRLPRGVRRAVLPRLEHEVLSTGFPRVLLPALRDAFAQRVPEPGARLRVPFLERKGRRFREVSEPGGGVLGRGGSAAQARIRALALVAAAFQASPFLPGSEPLWEKLGHRLAHPVERSSSLWIVREERTLAMVLRPGRRPSSRQLRHSQVVPALLGAIARGAGAEVVAGSPEGVERAAGLARLATRGIQAMRAGGDLAIEHEGVVYRSRGGRRWSRFSLLRFISRPRYCRMVLESSAATIAATGGAPRAHLPNAIECTVLPSGETRARIHYESTRGEWFEETVPLAEVELHLRESRLVLEGSGSFLAVRASEALASHLQRLGTHLPPELEIQVSGAFPFGLMLGVGGERFEVGQRDGWSTAAEATLALWQPGAEGRLAIRIGTLVHRAGPDIHPVSGLLRLYVRSVVARRLNAFILRKAPT